MNQAMRLPWTLEDVPHAILDIVRGCNIRCRNCFNSEPDRIKSILEVESELDALIRLRKLHSIAIVGGEITLHPELVQIVRMVKSKGLHVELFSNGVDLKPDLLSVLKEAGVSLMFLHIEQHQRRPDLPANATAEDLRRLREDKLAMISAHGIEAGLAVTVYPGKLEEMDEAVRFTLESPHALYLLVTLWRDTTRIPSLAGTLEGGMRASPGFHSESTARDNLGNREICECLEQRFGLRPFAFLGSNMDADDPRWLSYLIGTVHRSDALSAMHCLKPTIVEKGFLAASHLLTKRFPFYQPQSPRQFGAQMFLNGIFGGGLKANVGVMFNALQSGAKLRAKRLLFQCPATLDDLGRVVHCSCCPDAVMKHGRLVPLCISDCVVAANNCR